MNVSPHHARERAPAHRLRGWGSLRLRGRGTVVVTMSGSGQLEVGNLRGTAYEIQADGVRRFLDADRLVMSHAHGSVILDGNDVALCFQRGYADVLVRGIFDAVLVGRGEWQAPDGRRSRWSQSPSVRLGRSARLERRGA